MQIKNQNKICNKKRDFSFELRATTFFPQKIQTDKIHHQKARKISYPVVYLANLHYLFPGKAIFGLLSTGLHRINNCYRMDNIVAGLTRKVPSADRTSEELEFKNEQNKCYMAQNEGIL